MPSSTTPNIASATRPTSAANSRAFRSSAPPGLKPGASTEIASSKDARDAADAGATVEERPFKGRVTNRKKEDNSTLPKAVAGGQSPQATGATTDADIFRACVKAGQQGRVGLLTPSQTRRYVIHSSNGQMTRGSNA